MVHFVTARWSIRNRWKNNLITLKRWFKSSTYMQCSIGILYNVSLLRVCS